MIKISSPLKRKEIEELLNGNTFNGVSFKLVNKAGMELHFETNNDDLAKDIAKKTIKDSKFGRAIMFNVEIIK